MSSDRTGGSGISGNYSAIGSSCGRISASVRFLFTGSTTRPLVLSVEDAALRCRSWRLIVLNSSSTRWGDGKLCGCVRRLRRGTLRAAVERRLRVYLPGYRELPIVPAFSSLSVPGR